MVWFYTFIYGTACFSSFWFVFDPSGPQNILVNEDCDVKICDFGLAREYGSEGMTTLVATQFYRAPELLLEMSRPGRRWRRRIPPMARWDPRHLGGLARLAGVCTCHCSCQQRLGQLRREVPGRPRSGSPPPKLA